MSEDELDALAMEHIRTLIAEGEAGLVEPACVCGCTATSPCSEGCYLEDGTDLCSACCRRVVEFVPVD